MTANAQPTEQASGRMTGNIPKVINLKMMSLDEAVKLEHDQAVASDWYQVFFHFDVVGREMRVRVPVFKLDEEGNKIRTPDGSKYVVWDPYETALRVWGSLGTDEHDFLFMTRGPKVVVTKDTLSTEIRRRGANYFIETLNDDEPSNARSAAA